MYGWKEHLASALTGTTIDVSNMFIILSTAWTDVVDIWVNAKDMVVSPVEIGDMFGGPDPKHRV
jgi:hypothetical protein